MEQLQKMGIQIGFLISGLFGAILMATKNEKTDIKSVFLSLVGGMSAANFLTPVLVDTLNVTNTKHQSSGLYKIQLTPEELIELTVLIVLCKDVLTFLTEIGLIRPI